MALSGIDTSTPDSFTDAIVTEPGLVKLRDRVRIVADPKLAATQAAVVVESHGRRMRSEADSGVPAADLPSQSESLLRKFIALAAPVIGSDTAQQLAHTALHLDERASPADLIRLTHVE